MTAYTPTHAYLFTNVQSGDIEISLDEDAFNREMWHRKEFMLVASDTAEQAGLDDGRRQARAEVWHEGTQAYYDAILLRPIAGPTEYQP